MHTTISRLLSRHARQLKAFLPAHKIKQRPSVYIGSYRMRSSGHCTMLLLLKTGKNQQPSNLHRRHQQELGSSGTFLGNVQWPPCLLSCSSLLARSSCASSASVVKLCCDNALRPFYNCPSKQRVGTPPVAFDGGKWLCGVQTLLQVLLSA